MGCTNIKQARLSQNVPLDCDLNLQIESDRQHHIIVNQTKCVRTMIFQRKIIYPDEQLENTQTQIDSQSIQQNNLILALQNLELNKLRMSHSVDTTCIQDFTPKGILRTQQSQQFSTMGSAKKVTFKIDYFQEPRNSQNIKPKHMKRRKTTMKMLEEIF